VIGNKIKLPKYFLTYAVVVAMAFLIAACGRKTMPERPVDSDFPRSYPSQ
jgi:hypothetical protein